jgi:hypothetical protein
VARRPYHIIGASLCRMLIGVWMLLFYLQSWNIRHFIWGNDGPVDYAEFLEDVRLVGGYSLLLYSEDARLLDALCTLGVLASCAVMVGLFTRLSMSVGAILLWSFHVRNEFILDGGDNLGRILLIFMCLMQTDRLSVDRGLFRANRLSAYRATTHNVCLAIILVQVSLLYLSASLSKVSGPLWQNGTALYYVIRREAYGNPHTLGHYDSSNYFLVTIATYGVVGIQLAFPFLVWVKRVRPWIVGGLVALHVAIGYEMGLVRFSLIMIAVLATALPDETYRRLHAWVAWGVGVML